MTSQANGRYDILQGQERGLLQEEDRHTARQEWGSNLTWAQNWFISSIGKPSLSV